MKLLLVEDHQELAANMISFLTKENYICEWVKTVTLAKEMLEMFEYDVVLLDLTLPDHSGLHLLEYIKKHHISSKVIIISAQDDFI